MRVTAFQKKISSGPSFHVLYNSISAGISPLRIRGLYGSTKSLFTVLLYQNIQRPILFIAPTEKEARNIHQDILTFIEDHRSVTLFPPWETVSLDIFAFHRDVELARIDVLCQLSLHTPRIIVASLKAVMQKVMPPKSLDDYVERISLGDSVDRDLLSSKLIQGGYTRTLLVEEVGQFSVRGHIIDVYPPSMHQPVRMEFIGDEIESLRLFNPHSQRSTEEILDFLVTPAREVIFSEERKARAIENIKRRSMELELPKGKRLRLMETISSELFTSVNPLFLPLFYVNCTTLTEDHPTPKDSPFNGMATLFDYLPESSIIIFDDLLTIEKTAESIENNLDKLLLKAREEEHFYLEKGSFFLPLKAILERCVPLQQIRIDTLPLEKTPPEGNFSGVCSEVIFHTDTNVTPSYEATRREPGTGPLKPLAESIKEWIQKGDLVTFFTAGQEEAQRLRHLLEHYNIIPRSPVTSFLEDVGRPEGRGKLIIREGKITTSFRFPELNVVVLSDENIFGKKVPIKRFKSPREGYFLQSFGELKEGDYIVHADHGIGIYRGLHKLTVADIENDFLLLEYQDGDKLYIPVEKIDRIQRYIGPDGYIPKIDKLGGASWETTKEKIKKSIREVAEELISIYAAREVMEREAYSAPDTTYEEFCSTFEYEETPDQSRSIEDVLSDMSSHKPMDRLVCGDAGFGKTEVALRASFRAAMDGRQVALLVPTTILAEQHYRTFTQRLKNFPLRVEVLNRLKTKAEQKEILEGISRGTVDIIIGTHRILQNDVTFKNLGLIIIDEEQRFGVMHKEKLKKLRTLVDVLTLTATPIPRTLHLSLIGLRDLSIINTPPENRLPVRTYVVEFNEEVIQEAIRYEMNRNGQVFFLHDRVKSIHTMARFLEKLVPEAKIGVVHGRMEGKDIENTMIQFIRREYNLLVCTSIIASGIDIPTANTILINRADRFGLAQLYQIRGRVGRSGEESFAYLLVPKGSMLSKDAQRRLRIIAEFSEPGSGFKIAASDLDIRGAGNILGTSQSGHISAVGYELYTELMEKTIREIKGEPPLEEVRPEIQLHIPAFIPEDFMPDMRNRLITYKRLSTASTDEDLSQLKEELIDSYGFLPEEVENLFELMRIRNLLKSLKGRKIGYDDHTVTIHLDRSSPINPSKIIDLTRDKKGLKLTPDFVLKIPMTGLRRNDTLKCIREILEYLVT